MMGCFIVFEGPEGAGKSTQLKRLAARLAQVGIDPVVTREPGGTAAAEAIRQVLLDPQLAISPLSEFLLYSASRAQHVAELIRPALADGRVVICDRFVASSVAYQGYGRGLELAFIDEVSRRVTGGLMPDLTLLLDIDPAAGLQRIAARGRKDRLEQADMAFHQRVRAGYLEQYQRNGDWRCFDATLSEAALAEAIWQQVSPLLAKVGVQHA
jgi:dTMP kinase